MDYEGGRSEKDFVAFLNKHAGTHRAVGGGLDATGGTIAAMDEIVNRMVAAGGSTGESAKSYLEEARKAALAGTEKTQDKYSQYYVKVMEKAQANKDYVSKELARLQGIIAKGGLAPEKMDDLTSRSNILQRFIGQPQEKDEL